jgi:predicted SprT family Zn-dependent metalloprotease
MIKNDKQLLVSEIQLLIFKETLKELEASIETVENEIIEYQSKCTHTYRCTLDTDTWSSYVCDKCGKSEIVDFE